MEYFKCNVVNLIIITVVTAKVDDYVSGLRTPQATAVLVNVIDDPFIVLYSIIVTSLAFEYKLLHFLLSFILNKRDNRTVRRRQTERRRQTKKSQC